MLIVLSVLMLVLLLLYFRRMRVALACALFVQPDLLLLDEVRSRTQHSRAGHALSLFFSSFLSSLALFADDILILRDRDI